MKEIIFLLFVIGLSFSCLGPALSQRYACEHDKEMPFDGVVACMFSESKFYSQAEKDNLLLLCAVYVKQYGDFCKGQSSSIPWWVKGYRQRSALPSE